MNLINHEIGFFHEAPQISKSRQWVEGILGAAAIVAFVLVLLQVAAR
jgi:hypothetical protein